MTARVDGTKAPVRVPDAWGALTHPYSAGGHEWIKITPTSDFERSLLAITLTDDEVKLDGPAAVLLIDALEAAIIRDPAPEPDGTRTSYLIDVDDDQQRRALARHLLADLGATAEQIDALDALREPDPRLWEWTSPSGTRWQRQERGAYQRRDAAGWEYVRAESYVSDAWHEWEMARLTDGGEG